jgi:hypothetical protein
MPIFLSVLCNVDQLMKILSNFFSENVLFHLQLFISIQKLLHQYIFIRYFPLRETEATGFEPGTFKLRVD